MLRLQFLLSILALFLASPAYTATVEQDNQGRIPGSLSGPHSGDWLIDTRCDCFAENTESSPKIGIVAQWEYYNFHTDTTFILTYLGGEADRDRLCREYPQRTPDGTASEKNDAFCFVANHSRDEGYTYADYIIFNGQWRGLREDQKQGYMRTPGMQVDKDICPNRCMEWMKYKEHREVATSKDGTGIQVVYVDMDDMCDDCI